MLIFGMAALASHLYLGPGLKEGTGAKEGFS